MATARPLWVCPECGRRFANANQTHACGALDLAHHFEGRSQAVRATYAAFVVLLEENGPVTVLPEQTRIAFQVRMSFAAIMTRCGYLRGHLVLARRCEAACFAKVESYSPRNHLHAFELRDAAQLRGKMSNFIAEAYRVGCQEHLRHTD